MARRQFGRQYVVQWDADVSRFHVTLGHDSIGFQKSEEGAKALAAAHARRVTLPIAARFAVKTPSGPDLPSVDSSTVKRAPTG